MSNWPEAPALCKRAGRTLLYLAALFSLGLFYVSMQAPQTVATTADLQADAPLPKLIVVDAGHGGEDGGSVGYAGTVEAGLNLEVAQLVREKLMRRGIEVVMTREDEKALGPTKKADMAERRRILNTEGATLCVSIHMNAYGDRAVSGPMAFYQKGSQKGQRLAEHVIAAVCEAVEHPLRMANPGDYFVVRECKSPAVLVECGFISNAEEEKLLNAPEYREKIAEGVVKGISAFLQEEDLSLKGEMLLPEADTATIIN